MVGPLIGEVNSICDGENENKARIILDVGTELALSFTKEQLTELKDMVNDYLDNGMSRIMKGQSKNKVNMDVSLEIGTCDTSISLGPGGMTYDEAPYSLELRVQDSRGNRFELGLDLDQARTIHSIFSKYVQAQDMIAEVLQPR